MNPALITALSAFIIACIICVFTVLQIRRNKEKKRPHYTLKRGGQNPVISPIKHSEWESEATLNPAAVEDDAGKTHIFYRAMGPDGLSRIGHASSDSGHHFDERSMYPVFQPTQGYGMPDSNKIKSPKEYNPVIYSSGGGWGGCEDPRTVKIGDRVYMTYVAFGGWDSVRIGLTSIKVKDMEKEHWNWRRPKLISPTNEIHKNWVIFPEKINGKYAVLQGISPAVRIQYVDSLDHFPVAEKITGEKRMGEGAHQGRKGFWDNWTRGAGPPPIKTSLGWLLLYQAMDRNDPNKYKIGAMVLDMKDPTKIIYRSPQPILSPDMPYENDGKPGVVYASGAVIKGDNLLVYYGGGDKHVCVAETPLQPLLEWLVKYGKI